MARVAAAMLLLATATNAQFYEMGHFDRVAKITNERQFDKLIKEAIDSDKTLFVRFIASEG
eukprot:SAG31_NODE_11571_length_1017_cov_0.653595_1_plen_61_part_00